MKFLHFFPCLLATTMLAQSNFQTEIDNTPVSSRFVPTQITASIGYQGYDETQEYFGEGEYEIFIDNTNGVLDNPIIILDGFDPGDSRNIDGLYNSLNFNNENLADVLRNEGFDIVVLNAPVYDTGGRTIDGGGDYIQRNAMVLVELINFINTEKVGDEGLVILGPSMGGLIARYGLAYMEQNNLEHETRLYLSFDSPHKGANIPISLQYLINYLAQSLGNAQAQAIVDNVLNSPAAKEMLYDHLLGHLEAGSDFEQDPTKLLPEGAPNFRDAFQAELDALGFPQDVRNVAMVNGSGQGITIGDPGMQVIDTNLGLGGVLSADVILNFTPLADETIRVTKFETFAINVPIADFETQAKSLPEIDGVDSAPGGISFISNALGGAGGNQTIIDFVEALEQDEFSFIPVISALALDNVDDWYVIPAIGSAHTSPFVNTYIPAQNEPHVQVTEASAQFAIDEIRNNLLSTSTIAVSPFKLMQNPIDDILRVQLDSNIRSSEIQVTITSALGQEVFSRTLTRNGNQIDVPLQLESGIYMATFTAGQQKNTLKLLVH